MLKNEKVIHIGIRKEMNLPTDSMKNLKWWQEKGSGAKIKLI